ncbi:MAG: DUF1794 domain-containing protein [Actinomyces sp.]|nr:MAG: DUF1794 domain-containing protein [Actinomyces sp.]
MDRFGPLAGLIGEWEGDQGLDVSYHHAEGASGETPYREHIVFKPFGPVDNGDQHLYGLDYRMAAWRLGEELPFHTEVGYWLWDGGDGQVLRCFVIPRGSVVLAGGTATADARRFTLSATRGDTAYGILANPYLERRARTVRYEVTLEVGDATFSYEEDSVLELAEIPGEYHHTDRNTLRRVAEFDLPPRD